MTKPPPRYNAMADALLERVPAVPAYNAMAAFRGAFAMPPYHPQPPPPMETYEQIIPDRLRRTAWIMTAGSLAAVWCYDAYGKRLHRDACEGSPYAWDADHIIPRDQGGTDHPLNLRALNCSDNRSDGNRR